MLFTGINMQVFAQCEQCNATNCTTAASATGDCAFAQGDAAVASGNNSVAIGVSTTASGADGVAIGENATASGSASVAIGGSATAAGSEAFAIGNTVDADGTNSVAIGEDLEANTSYSKNYLFGTGLRSNSMINNISNSIMIGMNSNLPTVFVEGAEGATGNWGRVGIGTTGPSGILHIRDETSGNTDVYLDKASGEVGRLYFAKAGTAISSLYSSSADVLYMRQLVDNKDIGFYLNNSGELMRLKASTNAVGIGTNSPSIKLEVHADAVASSDETIALFTASDSDVSNERLMIQNRSTGNGDFSGAIIGQTNSTTFEPLFIRGLVNSGYDSGTLPAMTFDAQLSTGADLSTRPLFRWRNSSSVLMQMTADGDLGINTASPSARLHVREDAITSLGETIAKFTVSDDADNFFIVQNTTQTDGYFAPSITGHNESLSSASGLYVIGEIDSESDAGTTAVLSFNARRSEAAVQTRPLFRWRNYTTTEMLMDVNGNLGINTTSPSYTLHVTGTAAVTNTPAAGMSDNNLGINTNGQLVDLTASSAVFKENVEDIDFDKEAFLSLRPVNFDWKEAYGGGRDAGLIAQEVDKTFPELAVRGPQRKYNPDGSIVLDDNGVIIEDPSQTEVRGVRYHKLPVYLLAIVKEQEAEIAELKESKAELDDLRREMQELREELYGCCAVKPEVTGLGSTENGNGDSVSEEFVLLKNDPNPFSDYTDIKFEANGCEKCEIVVTDISGRIVKRIQTNDDNGTVRLYSSEIGKGIFTYSLIKDGEVVRTERMVSTK